MTDYQEFIQSKVRTYTPSGFDVNRNDLNKDMFHYQKDIAVAAIKKGKYAVFADCGLGKTFIELEFARMTREKTGNFEARERSLASFETDRKSNRGGDIVFPIDLRISTYELPKTAEAGICGEDDGLPFGLDEVERLERCGNAIVPQIAEEFGYLMALMMGVLT